MPSEEELARWQRVRPIMNEILQAAGLVKVAEDKVHVTGLKGPLEQGWQQKVAAFAARISPEVQGTDNGPEPARAVPPAGLAAGTATLAIRRGLHRRASG
jgi:hypothetical protein